MLLIIFYITVAPDKGNVRETGWTDVSFADDAVSEHHGRADSEAAEQELDLNLEDADHEEMLADYEEIPAGDEGTITFL